MMANYLLTYPAPIPQFDLRNIVYSGESKDVSLSGNAFCVRYTQDGGKMLVSFLNQQKISQFTTVTPFSPNGATDDLVDLDLSGEGSSGTFTLRPDIGQLFSVENSGQTVFRYGFPSPGDITGGSYSSVSADISAKVTRATGSTFSPDGTALFVLDGFDSRKIFKWTMPPWDIENLTFDSESPPLGAEQHYGVDFDATGTRILICNPNTTEFIRQYISAKHDISSMVLDFSRSMTAEDSTPLGVHINPENSTMNMCGTGSDTIFKYGVV